ncbi:hypothetical protein CFC21_100992 [Triticum aestivum]|uniref:B box-type domain-containing protein n=3 Tax=Triticum TaxID=4564 RepID=A0A9R0ZQU7_TRITD|nr:hypothetical protein CFC21_100992 [Triticum aestivum]VAI82415.1 unnamed protein product [Triticum turgidum subsp. durum]
MKIQCNACGAAEARVLCCADEAALCAACDEEVHAANRLAGKHQRVPLLPDAAAPPKCDICQEASGYFFCLEDRALLCRDCDVAIHTVNSFVSAHQRFLLTGVQVGLDPADPVPPVADKHVNTSGENSASIPSQNAISGDYSRQISVPNTKTGMTNWTMDNSALRLAEPPPKYLSDGNSKLLLSNQTTTALSNQMNRDSGRAYNLPFSGGNGSDSLPEWPVDEFFSNLEYGPNFGFTEHGSSKGDNAKLGSAGGSPQCRLAEGLFAEDLLGQVPGFDAEDPWVVPEVPSPPTASGLCWQGNLHYPVYDGAMFVPEAPSLQSSQDNFAASAGFKRRRREF